MVVSDGRIRRKKHQEKQIQVTWKIIPVSKWLITMVSKSPKDRVISPYK